MFAARVEPQQKRVRLKNALEPLAVTWPEQLLQSTAYVRIRQHTSAYVSIRPHTSGRTTGHNLAGTAPARGLASRGRGLG
jgi:hypothetical protein